MWSDRFYLSDSLALEVWQEFGLGVDCKIKLSFFQKRAYAAKTQTLTKYIWSIF